MAAVVIAASKRVARGARRRHVGRSVARAREAINGPIVSAGVDPSQRRMSCAFRRLAEGEARTVRRSGAPTRTSEDTPTRVATDKEVRRLVSEEDRIIRWRAEELERAGYTPVVANALAAQRRVDLHLAIHLVKSGCPHETAIRILL